MLRLPDDRHVCPEWEVINDNDFRSCFGARQRLECRSASKGELGGGKYLKM